MLQKNSQDFLYPAMLVGGLSPQAKRFLAAETCQAFIRAAGEAGRL